MIRSVALLSLHTSPLVQPGSGDAGGMNVYLHELAQTLADRTIDVVVFTRRTAPSDPREVEIRPGYRVVHVDAGPLSPLPISHLPRHVSAFAEGVIGWTATTGATFDVVHSHYWLSGWAGAVIKNALGWPHVNSFHTLGRVKGLSHPEEAARSTFMRTLTEREVVARADSIVAATPYEYDDLVDHYGAHPERLWVTPPGVSHLIFSPGEREAARSWLGIGAEPCLLFVGRIQPLKGLDLAVRTLAKLPEQLAAGDGPPRLLIVGGPSGELGDAHAATIRALTAELGVANRVEFIDPQPHPALAAFYRAADVLVMPSRTESFGLVAAEAQACGLPVVAGDVGGLSYVVRHGESGFLIDSAEPAEFADAVLRVLDDPALRARLSAGAVAHAERFSWNATAEQLLELYQGVATP